MLKTIFNLIKLDDKSIRFSKEKQFIKTVTKDVSSAYQQKSFILVSFNMIANHINKTFTIDKILIKEKPNLKLEQIRIVEKEKEITR
ncbi:MAG: hypothetical protein sL5_08840 [Candidatus Mesenet longicola]|uniref:Uncharacterized protein n=1 Tax=Candidatus Mesenet longicola TaxID=1892558 RepID=A0A8J3HX50_9RICK|nr:MAG: hypothetical protein sGL2_09400 [Candidatus Mesenet longicola]GHM59891.1 MAG: hypothetical protein sL5_08840 [Candidatus Mesenet longicola]